MANIETLDFTSNCLSFILLFPYFKSRSGACVLYIYISKLYIYSLENPQSVKVDRNKGHKDEMLQQYYEVVLF